jgi:hypothetical protein
VESRDRRAHAEPRQRSRGRRKHIGYRGCLIHRTLAAAKEARTEFPNAFGWASEHVVTATILTMLGAIALVIAGYALVSKFFL